MTESAAALYGKPAVIAPLAGGSGPMYPFVKYLGVPIEGGERATGEQCLRGAKHIARILAGMADL